MRHTGEQPYRDPKGKGGKDPKLPVGASLSDPRSESTVFIQGGFCEKVPGKILQVPFVKIFVEIAVQDFKVRFLFKVSSNDF